METQKWRKRRLLIDLGIKSDTDEFVRYDTKDFEKCLDNIRCKLDEAEFSNAILLVSQHNTMNQPVFWAQTNSDIDEIFNHLSKVDKTRFPEIWHFRGKRDPNKIWGRQLFRFDELFPRIAPSTIELLPGGSRSINNYPDIPHGYVRLEKRDRPYPFEIVESVIKTPTGEKMFEQVANICTALGHHQKKLIEFGAFLQKHGSQGVTFDFHYSDNNVRIADWDTDNETQILKHIEEMERA